MSTPDEKLAKNPWLQAGRFAFVVLYGVVIISALKWATNNIQQVLPSQRAVVWRTGGIHRVQNAGLLLAWPKPLERVVMIPSAEAVLERKVTAALAPSPASTASAVPPGPSADEESVDSSASDTPVAGDAEAGAGYLLTGDAGIVRLEVTVFYAVRNPYEYALQIEHVVPALDRLVSRSAVLVCASRDLDTILVARPELLASDAGTADQRARLRSDLVRSINRALEGLTAAGAGLGIEILRVDVQSKLPEEAISAFEEVLTATQNADQEIASAQTAAAYTNQEGVKAADRTLQLAQAQASERLSKAESDTASLQQLQRALKDHLEPGLMLRTYRERINAILAKAGSTTLVNPKDDSHLILDGARQ